MTTSSDSNTSRMIFRETTERFWILRLVTEIQDDGLYVRLEPLQRSFRRIPISQIEDANITTYSATTYQGWHWGLRRTTSGNTVYRLRGTRGVELILSGGDYWFIGSQRPEELKDAIDKIATTRN